MSIPDVPTQYKKITDECVLDLSDAAERIWPIVGELCVDDGEKSFKVETGDLVIIVKKKSEEE